MAMTTLADVAVKAGVTAATVSNVVRNRGNVGARTRQRVLAAIDELGYRANLNARALAEGEGRPNIIALIVTNSVNPFYPEFMLAVEHSVRQRGHFLMICNTNNDARQERAFLDVAGGSLVHGVLAMHADYANLAALESRRAQGLPMALCLWEQPAAPPPQPCVAVDFYQAGVIAAEHLLALGHRRIGAIVGSAEHGHHLWRYRGFADTLRRASVAHDAGAVRFGEDSIEAGREAGRALLAALPALSAIFVSNDLPAIGVLQAARDLGLDVPSQLSVIGITDIQLAHQVRPALTTVSIPIAEAADLAVEQIIAHQNSATIMSVTSAPRLVVRSSTAQVRTGHTIGGR